MLLRIDDVVSAKGTAMKPPGQPGGMGGPEDVLKVHSTLFLSMRVRTGEDAIPLGQLWTLMNKEY